MTIEMMNLALCSKQDLNELERLRAEVVRLRAALQDLLHYGDAHNWGYMPEGETIDRAREALKQ